MVSVIEEAKQVLGEQLGTFVNNEYQLGMVGTPRFVIQQAEAHLGLVLPEDYKNFVEEYGGFCSSGVFIHGICNADFENPMVCDGVRATLSSRKLSNLPHHLYLLVNEEGDEIHCIDCENGQVINWSPYHRAATEVLSANFTDYLESRVRREIARKSRR
ncbi:SMI1/KNR4 family protein [Deinococcus misasensis]|uniref:SMI1/KNR4 family protein n=1 Tax=Deinococcus misasensis TaxID=392413 RepID=UPI0005505566|nr:SMI1/KNR4 family protein [Deinococcus misasensis]